MGTAGAVVFVQDAGNESVQPQRVLLLLIPPAATENNRQSLFRRSRGVFQFHAPLFQQGFQVSPGVEEILREAGAQLALGNQWKLIEPRATAAFIEAILHRRQPITVKRHFSPAGETFFQLCGLRRFAN